MTNLFYVVRYVGVAMAFFGAILAASDGARQILDSVLESIKRAQSRFSPHGTSVEITASVGMSAAVGMSAGGLVETSSGDPTIEMRVDALAERVNVMDSRVGELEMRIEQKAGDLKAEINEVRGEVQSIYSAITKLRNKAIETDAKALPSVGVGILLSALPDQLVVHAWVDAVLLAIAAIAIFVYARTRWGRRKGISA